MDTPAALAKPSAPDLKKAQESVQEVKRDVAELQRLEAERSGLKEQREDIRKRLIELHAAANEVEMALQQQATREPGLLERVGDLLGIGGSDGGLQDASQALGQIEKQMQDTKLQLQKVDVAMKENLQQTELRAGEVTKGLGQARQLSGKDPNTVRFLDAIEDAVKRRAWPAAQVRCDDANVHLAERYRKALIESAARQRPDDRHMMR